MVDQIIKSLSFDLVVQVPSTTDEFIALGGDPLKEAINNVLYRSYLAEFRDRFIERVQNSTGIKRKVIPGKPKKDGTPGKDAWGESEGKYLDRVCAEEEVELDTFAELVSTAQNGGYVPDGETETLEPLVFDPKKSERESGPKVPAKTYLTAAQQVIDAGNATVVSANLSKILGRTVADDKDSIANAIRDAENLEKKQLANKYAWLELIDRVKVDWYGA